uniref:Uncharacterized protein n=1 Tax=Acrobeloides nanus TaxID=290746 RepID=A0A914DDL8_9BILA
MFERENLEENDEDIYEEEWDDSEEEEADRAMPAQPIASGKDVYEKNWGSEPGNFTPLLFAAQKVPQNDSSEMECFLNFMSHGIINWYVLFFGKSDHFF